jgi:N-methylhydantoinase A
MPPYRLGIDIGGTFTDFALLDEATGAVTGFKAPTVPADPARGVLDGLRALLAERGIDPGAIGYLAHGTTIAVNTIIERSGARLGLLVTRGFGDVLELQRLRLASPVNFLATRPAPLVPRERVGEVTERLLADGAADTPLDEAELLAEARRLIEGQGAEGLVIAFLHAYRDGRHERAARDALARAWPDVPVVCSHEVWPQIREYERTLVAVTTAYVRPRVVGYLDRLGRELRQAGVGAGLHVARSNGGVTTAAAARQAPAAILLSGPAAGVVGAAHVCGLAGYRDLIALDMGGTSADIALVRDGRPGYSTDETVGGLPVVLPAVGVSSIGAGGGSVAWVDGAGVLKVGPRSAGADPGPACYGRGGREPTVADAFLAGGLLGPDRFAGGRIRLDRGRALAALGPLAGSLGVSVDRAAEAVVEVAVAGMYAALSDVLARHAVDPRDMSLVAFGGAGPLVGCLLAGEFHVPRVLVPPAPGTLCALGALVADVRRDDVLTVHRRLDRLPAGDLRAACRELEARARRWLAGDAPPGAAVALAFAAELRYLGQAFQVEVPLDPAALPDGDLAPLAEAFHARHRALYAHADPAAPVELIDLRLTATAATPKPPLAAPAPAGGPARPAGRRPVRYDRTAREAAVYRREDLGPGQRLDGPAVVEQDDTTTLVPGGWRAEVDPLGLLVIRAGG